MAKTISDAKRIKVEDDPRPIGEIAAEEGLTRDHVRRIKMAAHKRAVDRIRSHLTD